MKRQICILVLLLLLPALLTGCFLGLGGDKTATITRSSDSLSIDLPSDMVKITDSSAEPYEMAYANKNTAFLLLVEKKADVAAVADAATAEEYCELLIDLYGYDAAVKQSKNGNPCFYYEATIDGVVYGYYSIGMVSDDAFMMLQFGCATEEYAKLLPDFEAYEASVTLK